MKTLEDSQKKIQQLCELLKKDAVDPARKEAEAILDEAKAKAKEIVSEAEKQARQLHEAARKEIEQERNVFQSFMAQAARQSVEALRQEVEKKFFKSELGQLIRRQSSDPKIISRLIEAVISAIEKEGLSANLSAVIPQAVPAKEVNALLAQNMIDQLQEKSVVLGNFGGGIQVKLHDKEVTLDITDEALVELLNTYRKGFRELVFSQ